MSDSEISESWSVSEFSDEELYLSENEEKYPTGNVPNNKKIVTKEKVKKEKLKMRHHLLY
jgi:hypothetical protein